MANDRLRKCPDCGQLQCNHNVRRIADAIRLLSTGATNIDVSAAYRWISSDRRCGRAAFVEFKHEHERLGQGQDIALRDLTGTLLTSDGHQFEQRAFIVREVPEGFAVTTWYPPPTCTSIGFRDNYWKLMEISRSEFQVAEVIGRWLVKGEFTFNLSAA